MSIRSYVIILLFMPIVKRKMKKFRPKMQKKRHLLLHRCRLWEITSTILDLEVDGLVAQLTLAENIVLAWQNRVQEDAHQRRNRQTG